MTLKKKLVSLFLTIGASCLILLAVGVVQARHDDSRIFSLVSQEKMHSVQSFELASKAETISFEKRGESWYVAYSGFLFPAREKKVEDFLSLLSRKGPRLERSRTASAQSELGLNELGADYIHLYGDGKKSIQSIVVGNVTPTGLFFIRYADEQSSFSGAEDFSAFLSSERRAWYDLSLFTGSKVPSADDIQRIVVRRGADGLYTLIRSGNKWQVEKDGLSGFPLNAGRIEDYARALVAIQAEDFNGVGEPFEGESLESVRIELGNGTAYTIAILGMTGDGRALVARSGSPYRYLLQKNAEVLLLPGAHYFSAEPVTN